ncbi:hypothetical protein Hanom_Chr05g00422761 [Helianthus anomalus]
MTKPAPENGILVIRSVCRSRREERTCNWEIEQELWLISLILLIRGVAGN